MPSVSVVIPTYNRAHVISAAIKSVLEQSFRDLEVIVVDDASTDGTEGVVRSLDDGRVRYIRHEENKGAPAARNTGINAARGQYVAFQDSDDEWLPGKLQKQMEAFRDAPPEVGVVYSGFWRIKNGGKTYIPSGGVKKKEGNILKELFRGNFVATPTMVVRKRCFEKAGMFDEHLPRLQDWELVIRLSKQCGFKCVNEPLVNAYSQPGGISAGQAAYARALEMILTKHLKSIREAGLKLLSVHYSTLGNTLCQAGDLKAGRRYLIKSFMAYPLRITALMAVFVSLLGQNMFTKVMSVYLPAYNRWVAGR